MRRVAEMGIVLLVFIIAMNSAIMLFSPAIGTTTTSQQAAPSNSKVTSSITSAQSIISINGLISLALLPISVAGAIVNIAQQFLGFFFAYNDILTSSGLPVSVSSFINLTFNSIIIIVLVVTILDVIASLKGR